MGRIVTPDDQLEKKSFIFELDRILKDRHAPNWIQPKEHPTATALWEVLWQLRAWTVLMGQTHSMEDLKTLEATAHERGFLPLNELVYRLFHAVKEPDQYPGWFSDYVKGDHAKDTEPAERVPADRARSKKDHRGSRETSADKRPEQPVTRSHSD